MVYSGNSLTKEAQAVADAIAEQCDSEIECLHMLNEYAAKSVENRSVALQIREHCTFVEES